MRSAFSIAAITAALRDTVRRFPVETIVALLGTAVALVFVHAEDTPFVEQYERYVLASIFTAPMLLAVQLAISIMREIDAISAAAAGIARAVASALAVVIVMSIDTASEATVIQILTLGIASHAMTALATFRRGALATWNFNRALFLRLCLALVFTGVLTGGLMTAVGALDVLFGVDVKPEYYATIATLTLGIFNTIFVLAGIPTADEEQRSDLPRSLRWFVQFVLIPLVGVFLVILYAYGIKVVFFSELKGAVANYILSMGVASLLAWVLAWPMRDDPEHRFVGFYMRWLGVVMIPMAALLVMAITVRIMEYGVTPPRFAVASLTSFFVIVVGYLTVRRRPDLRMIPLVLCVIGVLTALGPLGSVSVTLRNQASRANGLLTSENVWDGQRVDATKFNQLPDIKRRVWFDAIDAMNSVDTLASQAYVHALGLAIRQGMNSRYWMSVVGMNRPDKALTYYQWMNFDAPTNDPNGLVPGGATKIFACDLPPAKRTTFGTWKISSTKGGLTFLISDVDDTTVDTLDVRRLVGARNGHTNSPLADRQVTSSSGRFTYVPMHGYISITDSVAVAVSLKGLMIVR